MKDIMAALRHRGVTLICPESIHVGPEVDPERISRDGVVLHPGTRLRGAETLIGPGCVIGEEAPATLDDCALGKRVHFRGGYATKSALLDDVVVGSGAQLREGCLLEEQATLGHTCGLKQTVLMPYATLGSLINFCDALLAGGTSRHDHSEVGSGFVHFNFTPYGTKATASLFGDVPRGVFLREPRIFLGGQAGAVGPVSVGYGTVVAAGSTLRGDVGDNQFFISGPHAGVHVPNEKAGHPSPARMAKLTSHNIDYIAQLRALRLWYTAVRWAFCGRFRLGSLLNLVCQDILDRAVDERAKRLRELAAVADDAQRAGHLNADRVEAALAAVTSVELPIDDGVVNVITEPALRRDVSYLDTLAGLDTDAWKAGQAWLTTVVKTMTDAADAAARAVGQPARDAGAKGKTA